MTSGRSTDHEERHRVIVDWIVTDLRPVRPRWPVGLRLVFWMLLDLIVATWAICHGRADFPSMLHRSNYRLELLFFGAAAVLAAHLALRSSVPGRSLSRGEIGAVILLTVVGTLLLSSVPIKPDYPLDTFVRTGLRCALGTTLFASAPWIGLAWAVARNAPMRGFVSGALVGGGAAFFSFTLMRIDCPVDEPLHLFAWHVAPAILLITVSTIVGGWLLRFRPSLRLSARAL